MIVIFIVFVLAVEDTRYDFMFIIEAKKPVKDTLPYVKTELAQLFNLIKITKFFKRVSIMAYRDFCCIDKLIEWSDWKDNHEIDSLKCFLENLSVDELCLCKGPVAVKTSLMKAFRMIERKTICFLYFESLPYHPYDEDDWPDEYKLQIEKMKGEHENWVNVCRKLFEHDITVFPIFSSSCKEDMMPLYNFSRKNWW